MRSLLLILGREQDLLNRSKLEWKVGVRCVRRGWERRGQWNGDSKEDIRYEDIGPGNVHENETNLTRRDGKNESINNE